MIEKFKTLFYVKSSLVFLYLALTIPIPFISIDRLKITSIITFVLGLYLIINITSDYVETCNNKISYKTSFISKALGKKNLEISWICESYFKVFTEYFAKFFEVFRGFRQFSEAFGRVRTHSSPFGPIGRHFDAFGSNWKRLDVFKKF